ncbi:hypothetical protein [Microbacterium resistens]|uniref:hypothetical protein n=1 Tax=Microbacterium resistens TaxID=156977 RepID=UPI001C580AAB|nr:hypothetical protein [Microbacterium resistens]
MTKKTPILGALPAPAWHRPWLRYADAVDGAEGATPTDPAVEAAPEPTDPPTAQDPTPTDEPPADGDADLPEWARKSLKKANSEAAAARLAAKEAREAAEQAQADLIQNLGRALGLVKENETPSVESLTQTLQERDDALSKTQAALAAERAEKAVLRSAGRHNADADALLDSRGFTEKLAEIDSSAADYATQVEALVKAEAESNSRYRKVQVAPRSSNGDPAPAGGSNAPKDDIESLRQTYRKSRGQD